MRCFWYHSLSDLLPDLIVAQTKAILEYKREDKANTGRHFFGGRKVGGWVHVVLRRNAGPKIIEWRSKQYRKQIQDNTIFHSSFTVDNCSSGRAQRTQTETQWTRVNGGERPEQKTSRVVCLADAVHRFERVHSPILLLDLVLLLHSHDLSAIPEHRQVGSAQILYSRILWIQWSICGASHKGRQSVRSCQ